MELIKSRVTNDPLGMYDQEKAKNLFDEIDKRFWPMIGTANQLAANAFFDAYDMLEEQGLLKQNVKRSAKLALKAWNDYQKKSNEILGDRWYLWQDVVCAASSNIQSDVLKLKMSIKQLLDKNKVDKSDIRSSIHLAQTLLEMAVMFYDMTIKAFQSKTSLDISRFFKFGRLKSMQSLWMDVTRHFSSWNSVIDLNDDPNIKLGVDIIIKRFEKVDFINEAAGKAMHLNPDMAKYASEEDKQYFT